MPLWLWALAPQDVFLFGFYAVFASDHSPHRVIKRRSLWLISLACKDRLLLLCRLACSPDSRPQPVKQRLCLTVSAWLIKPLDNIRSACWYVAGAARVIKSKTCKVGHVPVDVLLWGMSVVVTSPVFVGLVQTLSAPPEVTPAASVGVTWSPMSVLVFVSWPFQRVKPHYESLFSCHERDLSLHRWTGPSSEEDLHKVGQQAPGEGGII